MKTPQRFETAIHKLYTAFHNNSLHPECCKQCAVGTLLDGKEFWKHLSDDHGSYQLNYVGRVHEAMGRTFNGYSPSQLLQIERAFLRGCGYQLPLHHSHFTPTQPKDTDVLFEGLQAAIQVLYAMEGLDYDTSHLYGIPSEKITAKAYSIQ